MSGRLKFLLAVLAVGAGLSFWYTTNYAFQSANNDQLAANFANQLALKESCSDQDADGLCDYDETYWGSQFNNPDSDGDGYNDGEEVLSGHNPTKAGPDDFLNDKRNLTERAGTLLLGGLATGDLQQGSAAYEASVDALVDEIFTQYNANVATELDSIKLAPSNRDNLIAYSFRIAQILQPLFAEISANNRTVLETIKTVPLTDLATLHTKNPEMFKAFVTAADAEAVAFNDRIRTIKDIAAPTQMESFHRSLILYLRGTQQRYMALKTINKDPLLGMISLQVLNTLTTETPLELVVAFQNQAAAAINSK
jgi:hypothetical protein